MAELTIDKDMSGLLFSVESDNENAPQWSGKIKVNGEEYEIAVWENESKDGRIYMSAKIQEPREQGSGEVRAGGANRSGTNRSSNNPIAARPKPTRR